jgi:membrane-associated phospholipid phosphatase
MMKTQHTAIAIVMAIAQFAAIDCRMLSAADDTQTAGNVLACVLSAAAGGMVLGYCDGEGALQLGESVALAFGVTYALKYSVDEQRPGGGKLSFPSGHTAFSFSVAEFMRRRYGWEYGVPAYAAASFVAYSRVKSHQHYTQDVLAGAGIGILSGYVLTKPYKGWLVGVEGDTGNFSVRLTRQFR